MIDNKKLSKEYIEKRLSEVKEEIRCISRGKKKDRFQLPQVGRKPAELNSFGILSQGVKEIEHIDSSSHLKHLNDFYDIISSHPEWQEKPKAVGLGRRIKNLIYRPLMIILFFS